MKKIYPVCLVVAALALAHLVYANVVINEIMYDISGTDTGREWIEVANIDGAPVPLADWKLFEANTNHALTPVVGNGTLPVGGFAVIADNTDKFLIDFPSFTGLLFDSSFSLSNTGEALILRDETLGDRDSVLYTNVWGAEGDGNSLQKSEGGENGWVSALPTPGAHNSVSATLPSATSTSTTTTTTSTGGGSAGGGSFEIDRKYIVADAGGDRKVIVGASVVFDGSGVGTNGEPLDGAEYHWNFGDGSTANGQTVLHAYRFPGEYSLILTATSGKYSDSDGIKVLAEPSRLSVSDVVPGATGAVTLKNGSPYELDLSLWVLRVGEKNFVFPTGTHILSGHTVSFPAEVTGLIPANIFGVALLYPNGVVAYQATSTALVATVSGQLMAPTESHSQTSHALHSVAAINAPLVLGTTTASGTTALSRTPAGKSGVPFSRTLVWGGGFVLLIILGAGSVLLLGREDSATVQSIADRITVTEGEEE